MKLDRRDICDLCAMLILAGALYALTILFN